MRGNLRPFARILEIPVGVDKKEACQSECQREHDIPNPDPPPAVPGQEKLKQEGRKRPTDNKQPPVRSFLFEPFGGREPDQNSRRHEYDDFVKNDISIEVPGLDERESVNEACTGSQPINIRHAISVQVEVRIR